MSMSVVSPVINRWNEKGLEWTYTFQPQLQPFTISARGRSQLPREDYDFKGDEGVLIQFAAWFDHPLCGIQFFAHPNMDTKEVFTVNRITTGGFYSELYPMMTMVPPKTPIGWYGIANLKEWSWKQWARIYVINTDSVIHRCLGHSYTMAYLTGRVK